jgi:hypothetical protein
MQADRNPPAIIGDRSRAIGMQEHMDVAGVACKSLIRRIVDDLLENVGGRRRFGVHAGTFAYRLQAFENAERGFVVSAGGSLFGHIRSWAMPVESGFLQAVVGSRGEAIV